MDAVADTVSNLGLKSSVEVRPFVPHWRVPAFIRECDAILFLENGFPIAEHFSLVPLEALACGRPVLFTEEIAKKGIYRQLVPNTGMQVVSTPFSPETLQHAILQLLENLPTLQSRALSALDVLALHESALWKTAERWEHLFNLCDCGQATLVHT